jgi:hypothetical protein
LPYGGGERLSVMSYIHLPPTLKYLFIVLDSFFRGMNIFLKASYLTVLGEQSYYN